MLVFRDARRRVDTASELAALDRLLRGLEQVCDRDRAVEALIDAGALEAAVADARRSARDGFGAVESAWRAVTLEAARLFRWSRLGEAARAQASARKARKALAEAKRAGPPAQLLLTTPEGYAWGALYPETYLAAAERFLGSSTRLPAVVVGLRPAGASLSAVVAAALEAAGRRVESLTLAAPAGPVALDSPLERRLRRQAEAGAWFLIVDEGVTPGAGPSAAGFARTAEALNAVGAGDEQIVMFPSAALTSGGEDRDRWGRHRRLQVGFEALRDDLAPDLRLARDLSRGLWRGLVCEPLAAPAIAPQHERRKFLSADGRTLFKYAGLGRAGRQRLDRAERLAAAGFAPEPRSFRDGFIAADFVPGRPLRRRKGQDAAIGRAAEYLGWLGRNAATGDTLAGDELFPMIERNVSLALGDAGAARLSALEAWRPRLAGAPAVAIDGRLAPHEWIRAADGRLVKTDALDHHDDPFLPGDADLAWDVAGFAVEWGLDDAGALQFAQAAAQAAGDPTLPVRTPFYETAYLAFRTGWTQVAADAMPEGPDRRGLERQHLRYRSRLSRALDRMTVSA